VTAVWGYGGGSGGGGGGFARSALGPVFYLVFI